MNKLAIFCLLGLFLSCTGKTEHAKLAFLLKGNEAYENENLDKAIFYYKEAILADSTYVDAYLNNAIVLKAKGEYYGAIEMYDAVLEMNPRNEGALFNRANLYLDVDQYYRALDDLDALNKHWQDSSILYFTKGLVNTRLKRYDVAIREFKHSLQLYKNQPQALINIGNVFYYKEELDSAAIYLSRGLALDNTQANGFNTLGLISTRRKVYNEAINWFNKALAIDNQNAWYLNNKGFAFIKLEKFDSAKYLINTSMKLDPYNAWVYRNKGLLELQKNNLHKAINLLDKAYKMDNGIDNLPIDLVNAYIRIGDNKKACEILVTLKPTKTVSQLKDDYCK
jgi:tetratricopeptide (TPR) repeat protein